MDTNHAQSLKIEEHDFQQAKNSLKKYTEQAQKEVGLSKVPSEGGLFNLGNHKVTGSELNRITSQIQNYLIHLNNLSQNLVDEFVQVYNAFESLDKDYIAGIVTSIKAAEEVSKREQQDRKDIKKIIEQHEISVKVLRKFKEDIDKLKHLTDIDEAWDLLERQTELSDAFSSFMSKLSKIKHIEDVDTLWDSNETLRKDIAVIQKSLEIQSEAITDFDRKLHQAKEEYQQFIDRTNELLSESLEGFNQQVTLFTKTQDDKIEAHKQSQAESFDRFSGEQTKKLVVIEEKSDQRLDKWSDQQLAILESMSMEQETRWAEKEREFDEERAALTEQANALAQKVKMSQLVAGGAAALTVIQLLLILLGVI